MGRNSGYIAVQDPPLSLLSDKRSCNKQHTTEERRCFIHRDQSIARCRRCFSVCLRFATFTPPPLQQRITTCSFPQCSRRVLVSPLRAARLGAQVWASRQRERLLVCRAPERDTPSTVRRVPSPVYAPLFWECSPFVIRFEILCCCCCAFVRNSGRRVLCTISEKSDCVQTGLLEYEYARTPKETREASPPGVGTYTYIVLANRAARTRSAIKFTS